MLTVDNSYRQASSIAIFHDNSSSERKLQSISDREKGPVHLSHDDKENIPPAVVVGASKQEHAQSAIYTSLHTSSLSSSSTSKGAALRPRTKNLPKTKEARSPLADISIQRKLKGTRNSTKSRRKRKSVKSQRISDEEIITSFCR